MQVALPISLIVAFVFEMVAGGGGLGFQEIMAARFFRAPELYAALFAILLVGVALDRLLRLIRSRVLVWLHE
jgi:ABC-type nitrate/sulfonate/bicarbonate transport system permease component